MQLAAKINPGVSFIGEVQSFVKQVSDAVAAQELREWEQHVQEYNDRIEAAKKQWEQQVQEYNDRMETAKKQADRNYHLEQIRIRDYRDVAVEYAKNQPKEIYKLIW
jgi:molecular chaperone GrpE (heat shock protein)